MTRALRPLFAAIGLALTLAGCAATGDVATTGSIAPSAAPAEATDAAGWRAVAAQWAPAYDKDPGDATASLNYGRALRALGQRSQALAVLQTGAARNPTSMPLLGEYGRALAESGQFAQALDVLSRAHTPDQPNWRVLMAQGAVLDQMGRGPEAVQLYQTALKMAPGEPEILSNLGLSYALAGQLPEADKTLRQAVASPRADDRMRQNLALVLALEGQFDEAAKLSGQDLTPEQVRQNVDTLRGLAGQRNAWAQIKALDGKASEGKTAKPVRTATRIRPARAVKPAADEPLLRPSTAPDSQPAASTPTL